MAALSITVVSCVYGLRGYHKFVPAWAESVAALEHKPDAAFVASDRPIDSVYRKVCPWRHPQAFWLQVAIQEAQTDWVWILDIDDTALPDALNGIDDVDADVWMCGYVRSDGEVYVPPPLTAAEVLAAPTTLIPAGSAIRVDAFRNCGGYLDVALQDWALWRALARNGATFETSGRANYRYNRHPSTRGATELTIDRRAMHTAEMLAAEQGDETKRFAEWYVATH